MIESIFLISDELRQTFRLVDAIDILLVSAFLYASLLWFQQTASRGVLVGVAALAWVYFLARSLDMYLTSLAFHTTFAVLLFILVVVFQEDLRRLLERVASFRSVHFEHGGQSLVEIDALVDVVFRMASSKTGALIVLKRKESLERLLNGGFPLDGRFSVPLVYSIFDSSSPGHDGAIVIDRDHIEQYAAQLPISPNTNKIEGRGTRHSAALGLSERSDAVTIVVSEERGSVSVAQAGTLTEMATPADLQHCLEQSFASVLGDSRPPIWKQILVDHAGLKILSLIVAVAAWFVLAYDPHTVQRTFIVPMEYRNVAKQLEIDTSAPMECRVTLSGSERDFRFLDPASLKVSLDLGDSAAGYHEILLSEQNIRLPANLFPYRIDPRVVLLKMNLKRPDPPTTDPSTAPN
ncbi:DNA integrity scanning protein DisA [Stieleria neptunia]|uniref:Diadenylate cyclase n=1 Tax=Stieleria neptunia TaxID=2527979 RepID=A0A518HI67_9BACT|nr:diadenylate cyclase [Stieleria neptunia]QDV40537.1 DNA integrity scanning protein DisA [Stieleria neptunia]